MSTAAEDFKSNIEQQIKSITDRYQPAIDDLKARGQRMVDDFEQASTAGAVIGFDFDVEWKDETIIFDLPSVTMRTTAISLDIPEVSMETQTIIFHTPSVRMVSKKVGQYPEIHGWTIKWKDIIIDVPEPFMEEQKIIFDLPAVTMKRQDWKLDLPEFRMETQTWILRLPQFTLRNVNVETEKIKSAGEKLKEEGVQLGQRMRAEIDAVIATGQAVNTQGVFGARNQIAAQFDSAIAALNKAIGDLVAKGIDPIKIPTEHGDVNLRKQLADLIAQREAAIAQADIPQDVPEQALETA